MSKFRIGDTVRIVANLGDDFEGIRIGDKGVVVSVCEIGDYPIEVDTDEKYGYGFKEEELELIDETVRIYTDEYLLYKALQYMNISKDDLIEMIESR